MNKLNEDAGGTTTAGIAGVSPNDSTHPGAPMLFQQKARRKKLFDKVVRILNRKKQK